MQKLLLPYMFTMYNDDIESSCDLQNTDMMPFWSPLQNIREVHEVTRGPSTLSSRSEIRYNSMNITGDLPWCIKFNQNNFSALDYFIKVLIGENNDAILHLKSFVCKLFVNFILFFFILFLLFLGLFFLFFSTVILSCFL